MRAFIVTTLMTLGLGLTAGAAAADNDRGAVRHDEIRDHRPVREERVEHVRDYRARPAVRFERHDERRGYRWIGGEWRWNRFEWVWLPGHHVRIARW